MADRVRPPVEAVKVSIAIEGVAFSPRGDKAARVTRRFAIDAEFSRVAFAGEGVTARLQAKLRDAIEAFRKSELRR